MSQHSASVIVNAPAHVVYERFTHFDEFPKFMSFVKEVTYVDEKTSHWVVDIVGRHEWDAIVDRKIEDREIGWRSTDGMRNSGLVAFEPRGEDKTFVGVLISYDPPAGIAGQVGDALAVSTMFDEALQHDLYRFAQYVTSPPAAVLKVPGVIVAPDSDVEVAEPSIESVARW